MTTFTWGQAADEPATIVRHAHATEQAVLIEGGADQAGVPPRNIAAAIRRAAGRMHREITITSTGLDNGTEPTMRVEATR